MRHEEVQEGAETSVLDIHKHKICKSQHTLSDGRYTEKKGDTDSD